MSTCAHLWVADVVTLEIGSASDTDTAPMGATVTVTSLVCEDCGTVVAEDIEHYAHPDGEGLPARTLDERGRQVWWVHNARTPLLPDDPIYGAWLTRNHATNISEVHIPIVK